MKTKYRIPTAEEFEQASKSMKEGFRFFDVIRDAVLNEFSAKCPLCNFFILDQRDVDFRAYIFFKTNIDLIESEQSGVQKEIEDFIYSELQRLGRGGRKNLQIAFEFDSDENVRNTCGGDYFRRLK